MIKKELNIFLTAIMFYTRIPCPTWIGHSDEMLNKSTRYFPVVGWIVGGFTALAYWGAIQIFPVSTAILLSMAFGILVTGAFHEDGFADVCDGFGGGWTKESRLNIMKDSRIGTYGSVGLILIHFIKFSLLMELAGFNLVFILIIAHSVSRIIPVFVVYFGTYSREDLTSKVKPVGKKISLGGLLFAFLAGLAPVILIEPEFFTVIILPLVAGLLLMRYFKKRINGYTGDCLGAIQQVSEICVYISIYLIYQWI